MSVLISQVADVLYRIAADDFTEAKIRVSEDNEDYDFFIKNCQAQADFYNDLIYRLKQEKDEIHKS